jgi:VanZ family protein
LIKASGTKARLWSFRVWPALLDAALILVVGSLPMAPPGAEKVSDKTLHAIAFGIFAWLASRAVRFLRPAGSRAGALLVGFAASVALGGGLELWQMLLPYRSSEWLDFVADALGALLAVTLTAAVWRLGRARVPLP